MSSIQWMTMLVAVLLVVPAVAQAQSDAGLIAELTVPLPPHLKDGAAVYAVDVTDGNWREVRPGTNGFACHRILGFQGFQALCVHESNVPRAKEQSRLVAQGMTLSEAGEAVGEGFRAGTIPLPAYGALTFWASGPDIDHANLLTVISMPYATAESIDNIPTEGDDGTAWLMNAGTPGAHLMIGSPPYGF